MVLPSRIKLKKDCTKNACVHPCSISELVKPSSKMTLLYPKIAAMWQVQVKSHTHYLIQTNSRETYYLLLYSNTFQDHFKGPYHSYKKTETFYRLNSRWLDASFDTEKSWLQVYMVLQKFILVKRRCLYKSDLKRTIFTVL